MTRFRPVIEQLGDRILPSVSMSALPEKPDMANVAAHALHETPGHASLTSIMESAHTKAIDAVFPRESHEESGNEEPQGHEQHEAGHIAEERFELFEMGEWAEEQEEHHREIEEGLEESLEHANELAEEALHHAHHSHAHEHAHAHEDHTHAHAHHHEHHEDLAELEWETEAFQAIYDREKKSGNGNHVLSQLHAALHAEIHGLEHVIQEQTTPDHRLMRRLDVITNRLRHLPAEHGENGHGHRPAHGNHPVRPAPPQAEPATPQGHDAAETPQGNAA